MSADSHTVCPKCHPDLLGYTGPREYPQCKYPQCKGSIDFAAEELGYDRSVRENIQYALLARDGKLVLNFTYDANCWDCDFGFGIENNVEISTELSGLGTP